MTKAEKIIIVLTFAIFSITAENMKNTKISAKANLKMLEIAKGGTK